MLIGLLALGTVTGCTPNQIRAWVNWYETDPEAATEFANRPEIREELSSDAPQFEQWLSSYEPGNCDSYVPLFEEFGLPVATFKRIAWRESGCNHLSFVRDSDDLGGGLLGINLRAGASNWFSWCGLTVSNVTDASKNVECASEAYQRMGMQPWS
jgi:hypothetical protein